MNQIEANQAVLGIDALDSEGSGDQYLTFMMAGEEYGVDILRVQEIKGWDKVTTVPNTPDYIKGVMNLRGTIVPIVDLRLRFGLEAVEYGAITVVIVLRVEQEARSRIMGVVVDAVSDVYSVPVDSIKPPPDFGGAIDTEFLKGLATLEEKLVVLLDIDKLLNAEQLGKVGQVASQPTEVSPPPPSMPTEPTVSTEH
ncbi:MAG: chemotaxis protein CheW [Gammaproteobacteria bacterium]|nr:chemotaxis protein CheW [Gammaproteobacteria bacterium]